MIQTVSFHRGQLCLIASFLSNKQSFLFAEIGVVGFSLVDSVNNLYLQDVNNGDTLDLDQLEELYRVDQFTIVCNTTGPVQSVLLTEQYTNLAGDLVRDEENPENDAPWTLAGDSSNGFGTTPFAAGSWTASCEPFCGSDQSGASGGETSIDFTVTQLDCSTCKAECISITGPCWKCSREMFEKKIAYPKPMILTTFCICRLCVGGCRQRFEQGRPAVRLSCLYSRRGCIQFE